MQHGQSQNRVCLAAVLVVLLLLPGTEAAGSLRRSPVVIAVENIGPAVVNISTLVRERVAPMFPFARDDFFRDFFPDLFPREYTHTSLGSGVVIDGANGYVVTNHHVVSRATEIHVISSLGVKYQAKILGSDPRSDLAVLQIEAEEKLPEGKLGNSDDLMIGETVIAIGNPFGLSHTVTTGVVSALHRSVRAEERVYRNFIQTDASINPGNSGGPLLNINGEIIGINTAIYQKAQGIGFAIPSNKVRRIVRELIRLGEVRLPWLGLEVQELTPELRGHFGLPEGAGGVLVRDIYEGSPAQEAGIRRGDTVISIGAIPIKSLSDYSEALAEFTSSDPVRLEIYRKGKERELSITPTVFPQDLALDMVYRRLGIVVEEMDDFTRRRYGLEQGVSITEVREGSEAGRIGLQPGDAIIGLNNAPIETLDDFKKQIGRYHHQPSLTLLVRRGRAAYSVTLPFM